MFRAIDKQTGGGIIILDDQWNESTIESLKETGKSRLLSCPVCKEDVFVKAGKENRWHFAHYSIKECPLTNESSDILQARSILYKWLQSKFSEREEKVWIEKKVSNEFIKRPIDCYVDSEKGNFLYWIIKSRIVTKDQLQQYLNEITDNVNWLFLSNMLKLDSDAPDSVKLSPTERFFAYESKYEKLYGNGDGESIHYLNISENVITTLRGLLLTHAPHQYSFEKKLINKIDEMKIYPKIGAFVHPGEHEKKVSLLKQEEESQQLNKQNDNYFEQNFIRKEKHIEKQHPKKSYSHSIIFPCERCGGLKSDSDCVEFDYGCKTCLCRECAYANKAAQK